VRRELLAWSRRSQVRRAGDKVLALGLAVASVVPVLTGDPSWGTPKALGVVLALLSTLPLGWRSRYPLTVAAIVIGADAACIFAAVPHQPAFQPFVALTLSAYSVGSWAEGDRAAWMPPALALAALPLFVAAVVHGQSAGNVLPSYVWLIAAWAAGRTIRSSRSKSEALEVANRQLAEQRERAEQAAIAVERGRIARELHDVIAHNVAMMVVQAGAATRVLDGDQPDVRNALEAIALTGRQTVEDMRTVLGGLRSDPSGLGPQPGLSDLEHLATVMGEAGLPVTVRVEGKPHPLPQVLDLSAFRIVQEALTNALKHAGPARATVTVHYHPETVELDVVDSGAGGDGGYGTGNGLIGMRERAAMFGGELDARPTPSGFRVHARLPLSDALPR
jgi:signal transduction histidine kinase